MLGRKDYTNEELDHARAAVREQLAAFRSLAKAAPTAKGLGALETVVFNNAALALDRRFVHRIRTLTGKDTNPLSEVELVAESLMNNGGTLAPGSVVKYVPAQSVLKLAPGDRITLSADQFEELATAFLDEIEKRS